MATTQRVQGRNLMLFKTAEDGKASAEAFAFAESCSVNSNLKLEEVSDKDAPETGDQIMVGAEWTASTTNGMASIEDYAKVMDAHLSGTPITLAFTAVGNPNKDGITSENAAWTAGDGGYYGKCLIESVQITASNGQKASFTANFKGVSTLKKRS